MDNPLNNFEYLQQNIFSVFDEAEREAKELEPTVIAIQKKKFLIALKEISEEEISENDEKTVKTYNNIGFKNLLNIFKHKSIVWDDTKADKKLKEIFKRNAKFNLSVYLIYAKAVFLSYAGLITENITIQAKEYILVHSRQFGDSNVNIFNIDDSNSEDDEQTHSDLFKIELPPLPMSKFYNKINQLITDLASTFDETKFVILNANATYFTLLMLRRIVKNEVQFLNAFKQIATHDNYVKLCPYPLDNQLPKCEFQPFIEAGLVNSAYLAIEAYLKTTDEKTKKILRATSVTYMEWNGLQLPHLFFRVVKLYKINADKLFDLLLSVDAYHTEILKSLLELSEDYYKIFMMSKEGMTNSWFPYCRVLNGDFHLKLSAKENTHVCMILAFLVDLKIGFDKSSIRNAHWMKQIFRDACMCVAKSLYEKIDKF